MPAATHLLVGNPTAQSGRNAARIRRAQDALAARRVACDLFATLPDGGTVAAVQGALDRGNYRCVIAMGGDGTFREVASGILQSARREEVALGMLPTGTANDQGRSFGLSADENALEHNVAVILEGHETRLDAGRIRAFEDDGRVKQEAYFFDSAGWGISARVLRARNLDRRIVDRLGPLKMVYRDQLVYAGALFRTFLASYVVADKFSAYVTTGDGRHHLTRLTDLVIKATKVYGGAWVFDRTSRHDDGLFEVVPFRGKRDWTSKAIVDFRGNPVTEEMLNRVGIRHSRPFRASRMEVRFEVPRGGTALAAQIDGEEFPATHFVDIEVIPRAIRLVVPDEAPGTG